MDGIQSLYERCDGACELELGQRAGCTAVVDLYQSDPCRMLVPAVEPDDSFMAVFLTTSGGLTGGDRVRLRIKAGAGTAALATTQAAEKIYRSHGPDTRIEARIATEKGAWFEWMPQGTILFDGARLVRRTDISVEPGARVLASEIVVFGRTARGETFHSGLLHDAWSVRRDGRLVWADAMRLEADITKSLNHPAGFGGAVACATVIYVADDAASWIDTARALLADADGRTGATLVNGVLVVRLLNRDTANLYRDLAAFWMGFRVACGGLPSRLPRVWQC
jgi:urease accessory protein